MTAQSVTITERTIDEQTVPYITVTARREVENSNSPFIIHTPLAECMKGSLMDKVIVEAKEFILDHKRAQLDLFEGGGSVGNEEKETEAVAA